MTPRFVFNDGGRKAAGYRGFTSDCVVRAIAIAAQLPYQQVYSDINVLSSHELFQKHGSSARGGVHKPIYRKYLESLGWHWTPCMFIGQGCRVHLRPDELPKGRLIVSVSRHMVAVIDGVSHDTSDPTRKGMRCVYGFFSKKPGVTL